MKHGLFERIMWKLALPAKLLTIPYQMVADQLIEPGSIQRDRTLRVKLAVPFVGLLLVTDLLSEITLQDADLAAVGVLRSFLAAGFGLYVVEMYRLIAAGSTHKGSWATSKLGGTLYGALLVAVLGLKFMELFSGTADFILGRGTTAGVYALTHLVVLYVGIAAVLDLGDGEAAAVPAN